MSNDLVITDIRELVTWQPLVSERRFANIKEDDLGRVKNAWCYVEHGQVADFGSGPCPYSPKNQISAEGGLVLPGLVDSHTHLLFGGSRAEEFTRRLAGATYQEIAAMGGGIQETVRGSRALSDEEHEKLVTARLQEFLRQGVTTLEAKSGYGLSVDEELRHLRILNRCKANTEQTLSVTCLALHAASPDYDDLAAYIKDCRTKLLPKVKREGLADWVDAFIENGYFQVEDVNDYMKTAKELGFGIRIHADEFSDAGAALAAVHWGAASADHMQFAADEALGAMATAGTVATLLPGTSLYTNIRYTNGERFVEAGVPVAVASDYNPGSSYINNLAMLATLSSLYCGISPYTALAGVTLVAAKSLNLEKSKGALAQGMDADLCIYKNLSSVEEWIYDFGKTQPTQVLIGGENALS